MHVNPHAMAFTLGESRNEEGLLVRPYAPGLTKRELFAAMAMQGLVASDVTVDLGYADIAEEAVASADALIAALNEKDAR